ncbi:MAG: ABC transporter permease subunit, partial [Terriglobales bacterium]
PLVTIIALSIPALFSGAPLTETVFGWPGVGRLLVDAVLAGDFAVAQGIIIFLAALVIVFNLLADISYPLLDPRIRYD